jgi:hypothetical protein
MAKKYRSSVIDDIFNNLSIEEQQKIDKKVREDMITLEKRYEDGHRYGTKTSYSLKVLKEHGFNPIGICVVMCEETFVFETSEEAQKAYNELELEKSLIDGFFYGKVEFENEVKGLSDTPKIDWL